MDISKEIEGLDERLFTSELLDSLLAAFWGEAEITGISPNEEEYKKQTETLHALLNEEQKALCTQTELLYQQNLKRGMRMAFHRGLFAFFQQRFSVEPLKQPFRSLIYKGPQDDYHTHLSKADQQLAQLEAQLPREARLHLEALSVVWDDIDFGVLRYAFYLGYLYGYFITLGAQPPKNQKEIFGQLLHLELDLDLHSIEHGFTRESEKDEET